MMILLSLLVILSLFDVNIPEKNIIYKNYYIYIRFVISIMIYIFITLLCIGFKMKNTTLLWSMISFTCITSHLMPFFFKYIIPYEPIFYNSLIYIIIFIHGLICMTICCIFQYAFKCLYISHILQYLCCCCNFDKDS